MNNILKMRTVSKIVFSVAVCALLLLAPACNDILNVETERVLFTEDNKLNKADDLYYSAFGILRQFQSLGEKYVILGELRADLMDVTVESDVDLQAISNHTVTADNPYIATIDYYAVINNCNYYIQHADTSISKGGYKILYTEYALIKALRAWTYFQLAVNYGKATYLEKPIISLADMNENHPVYDINQLIDVLIADLAPYVDVDLGGSFGEQGYTLPYKWFVPVQLMLADLLLWKGDYGSAAYLYYVYINNHAIKPTNSNRGWESESFEMTWGSWPRFNDIEENEFLYGMFYSVEKGFACPLMNKLSAKVPGNRYSLYMLKPSNASQTFWDNQIYTYYNERTREINYKQGDLRGGPALELYPNWITYGGGGTQLFGGSYNYYINEEDTMPYINKFVDMDIFSSLGRYYSSTSSLYLYRASTLYLRFAEALNRSDKPTMAFAILKYGLNRQNLALYVDRDEIASTPFDFSGVFYDNAGGIRQHGLGWPQYDTTYVIPSGEKLTRQDTINFVEDKILEELALETAFEGNRFGDLMRFSQRRGDPSILANAVAKKNPALLGKLMNPNNWFLPTPTD
ncbi:hypothetical protein FACS1894123_01610 [Bacteroidia bacterium]|nr:hypothetical protein FACS1894123_01610 [Bacteroidia bacterium]